MYIHNINNIFKLNTFNRKRTFFHKRIIHRFRLNFYLVHFVESRLDMSILPAVAIYNFNYN